MGSRRGVAPHRRQLPMRQRGLVGAGGPMAACPWRQCERPTRRHTPGRCLRAWPACPLAPVLQWTNTWPGAENKLFPCLIQTDYETNMHPSEHQQRMGTTCIEISMSIHVVFSREIWTCILYHAESKKFLDGSDPCMMKAGVPDEVLIDMPLAACEI